MARLRYLDRTYYEKAHGQSMDKYCDMTSEAFGKCFPKP